MPRFGAQLPPSQKVPTTQSPSPEHEFRQPLAPPHRYGEQFCTDGSVQLPAPLHEPAGWNDDAEVQDAPAHCVALPGWAQTPPLHRPVLPQVLSVGFEQRPCGSAALSLTVVHVPRLPGRLHA